MKNLHTFEEFLNEAKIIDKTTYSIDYGVKRQIYADHKYWSTQETNMQFGIVGKSVEDLIKQIKKEYPKCSMYIEKGELIITGYGGGSLGEPPETVDLKKFMKDYSNYKWSNMTVVKLSTKLKINNMEAEFEKSDYKSSDPSAEKLIKEMNEIDKIISKSNIKDSWKLTMGEVLSLI